MQIFTHFDLQEITKKEEDLKKMLGIPKKEHTNSPKKQTINNILNYSKALSVRESKTMGYFEMLLN